MRILIILLFVFCACTRSGNNTSISQGLLFAHGPLRPFESLNQGSVQIISQVYETLFSLNDDFKSIVPNLALSGKMISNQQQYRIKLKPDIVFSNGKNFTADDVRSSFKKLQQKSLQNIIVQMVQEVVVEDSLTIIFQLKKPSGGFLYYLTSPYGLLIFSRNNAVKDKPNYLGTGPFKIVKEGERHSIRKNDLYWGEKAKLDNVYFKYYANDSETYKTLADGQVDILSMVAGHAIDRLKWMGKVDYYVQNPLSVNYLGFNNQNKLMRNVKLRAAIRSAIDKKKIVFNTNRGNAIIANGVLPPVYYYSKSSLHSDYDQISAKKLLREAKVDSGIILNMAVLKIALARQTLAENIKSQLQKVGIKLNIIYTKTWEEHDKIIKSERCHLFLDGMQSEVVGDAELFLKHVFHSKSEYNTLNYKNLYVDNLLLQLERESITKERQKLYDDIMRQIEKDVPAIFLYHVKTYFAYNKEKIKKITANPYGFIEYNKVELNTE